MRAKAEERAISRRRRRKRIRSISLFVDAPGKGVYALVKIRNWPLEWLPFLKGAAPTKRTNKGVDDRIERPDTENQSHTLMTRRFSSGARLEDGGKGSKHRNRLASLLWVWANLNEIDLRRSMLGLHHFLWRASAGQRRDSHENQTANRSES